MDLFYQKISHCQSYHYFSAYLIQKQHFFKIFLELKKRFNEKFNKIYVNAIGRRTNLQKYGFCY